jgi:hypothetical protein
MILRALRGAQADDQGVVADPIAEDRQRGEMLDRLPATEVTAITVTSRCRWR